MRLLWICTISYSINCSVNGQFANKAKYARKKHGWETSAHTRQRGGVWSILVAFLVGKIPRLLPPVKLSKNSENKVISMSCILFSLLQMKLRSLHWEWSALTVLYKFLLSHQICVIAFIFVLKTHTIRQENCPFFTKSLFYSEDVKLWTQVKLNDVSCAEPFCTNITIRILTTKDSCWFAVWWGCHLFANIILLMLIISLACATPFTKWRRV